MSHQRQTEIVSGLSAGLATTLAIHPLDLIKVRMQLAQPGAHGILNALRSISVDAAAHRNGTGARGLRRVLWPIRYYYRGLGPNLVGNVSAWGLYFFLYAEFKQLQVTHHAPTNYLVLSLLAGTATALATNPVWVLKTRILGSSRLDAHAYTSIWDGVRRIMRLEGIRGFWRGSIPGMLLVFQGSLQFTAYEILKGSDERLLTGQYIYASATAKVFSMSVMYPMQVVKTRLQDLRGERKHAAVETVKTLWKQGKLRAFYRGWTANVVRVVPATCVTFVTYEKVKGWMNREGL